MNIKELAQTHTSTQIKNISELEEVSVDLDAKEMVFKKGQPDEFRSIVTTIEGIDYRIPKSVLSDLKVILEMNPTLKKFKVLRSGQGRDHTRYTVMPLS